MGWGEISEAYPPLSIPIGGVLVRERGTNGVMKLPGRVMAGGVVLAGVFVVVVFFSVAACQRNPALRPTRDPREIVEFDRKSLSSTENLRIRRKILKFNGKALNSTENHRIRRKILEFDGKSLNST